MTIELESRLQDVKEHGFTVGQDPHARSLHACSPAAPRAALSVYTTALTCLTHLQKGLPGYCACVRAQVFRGFYDQHTVQAIRDVIEPEFEEIFRADADAIRTKLGAPVEVWIPRRLPLPPLLLGNAER